MLPNHPAVEAAIARGQADRRDRRDRFAAAALTGLVSIGDHLIDGHGVEGAVREAVELADAMIAALDRTPEAEP